MTQNTTATTNDPVDASGEQQPAQRGWVPTTLVVLATVIAVVSATTTWVRVQALDTDQWVETSTSLLAEPEVQEALATYLVDELYASVDIATAFESLLPGELGGLAAPLAGALRGPAIDGVQRVIERPRIQQVWEEANRRAHGAFVAIVRDETRENVSAADGTVVLDLGGLVRTVGEDLGIGSRVLDRIPADAGQIVIIESDELADVQDAVRVLDLVSFFLFAVVVALYALAVYLARGRRRAMWRNVGIALAIGGVVLYALRSVAVRATVEALVEDPTKRSLGRLVGEVFTQLLADMAVAGVVIGLVFAAYAALLGPSRVAVATRTRLAAFGRPGLVAVSVTAALVLLLAWWSPGNLFERWITTLTVLGVLVGAGFALAAALGAETAPEDDDPDGASAGERQPELAADGAVDQG